MCIEFGACLGQPCDPVEVVEAIRTDRPGTISHIAQYAFLYKVKT
jgi:hypothetical protein